MAKGFYPPENKEYFDQKAKDLGMVLYNIDNCNIAPGDGILTLINEFMDIANPQERKYLEKKTQEIYQKLKEEPLYYFFREAEKHPRR